MVFYLGVISSQLISTSTELIVANHAYINYRYVFELPLLMSRRTWSSKCYSTCAMTLSAYGYIQSDLKAHRPTFI